MDNECVYNLIQSHAVKPACHEAQFNAVSVTVDSDTD
jgi:hypothetical protein